MQKANKTLLLVDSFKYVHMGKKLSPVMLELCVKENTLKGPQGLLEEKATLGWVVHPALDATWKKLGGVRTKNTYSFSTKAKSIKEIKAILEAASLNVYYSKKELDTKDHLDKINKYWGFIRLQKELEKNTLLNDSAKEVNWKEISKRVDWGHITIEAKNSAFNLTVLPSLKLLNTLEETLLSTEIIFNKKLSLLKSNYSFFNNESLADAFYFVENLPEELPCLAANKQVSFMHELYSTSLTLQKTAWPNVAMVTLGRKLQNALEEKNNSAKDLSNYAHLKECDPLQEYEARELNEKEKSLLTISKEQKQQPVLKALSIINTFYDLVPVGINANVLEIADMSAAGFENREGLYPHQDYFCSIYKKTNTGMVNAMPTGTGKTVSTLRALEEKSDQQKTWKGLIVVPANLKEQWRKEAEVFFKKANSFILNSEKDLELMKSIFEKQTALFENKAYDVKNNITKNIIIVSYDFLANNLEAFKLPWDDLVCDEATVLKNNSKRSKALFEIRNYAKRALALTGTPAKEAWNDLLPISNWCLKSENQAQDTLFLNADEQIVKELFGPTIFMPKSQDLEILPAVQYEKKCVELESLEKDYYKKILQKNLPPDATMPHYMQKLNSLRVRSSTGKEKAILERILLEREGNGQTLVFTDSLRTAEYLHELFKKHALHSGVLSSEQTSLEKATHMAAFLEKDLNVLLLLSSSKLGLNLQTASLLIMHDLPLLQSDLTQMIARAARIGNKHSKLKVLLPYEKGTIDEVLLDVLLNEKSSMKETGLAKIKRLLNLAEKIWEK